MSASSLNSPAYPTRKRSTICTPCFLRSRSLRRRTGLPHRIVVDEAHYFLDRPDVQSLLDLELAGYALVTYRVSQLRADVLATIETVVFTHENDAGELRAVCEGFCVHLDAVSCGGRPSAISELARP